MSGDISIVGRCAAVFQQGKLAGHLQELPEGSWQFTYEPGYKGLAISLTMPVRDEPYHYKQFPAVFDGLLPEGLQLEALLRKHKIDRTDFFKQLVTVGEDLVGSLAVRPATEAPTKRRGPFDG
ncbi:MAG: HipA N-terminal domain-containing protein [Puniceicoccaceae bacterium]